MEFPEVRRRRGRTVDAVGVAVMVLGLLATGVCARQLIRHEGSVYVDYRRRLGRAIRLGLEFLVAADIIRTVAVYPDLRERRGPGA